MISVKLYVWHFYLRHISREYVPLRAHVRYVRENIYNTPKPTNLGHVMDLYIDGLNLEEIGHTLGMNRERVRQFLLKSVR